MQKQRANLRKWMIACPAWFLSGAWALMYFNLSDGKLYHPNRGGLSAAIGSAILFIAMTVDLLRKFRTLPQRNLPD
jgi:hypothetical protein